MAELSSESILAACVAIDGKGVLIEARDDAQRTDLLLRLLDRGATLVVDARTVCVRRGKTLCATVPAGTGGRVDVRGIGAVEMPNLDEAPSRWPWWCWTTRRACPRTAARAASRVSRSRCSRSAPASPPLPSRSNMR